MSDKIKSTIMFTDIVGYSAMVNKSQDHAMELLSTHDSIIEPMISKNNGKVIKKIGDAIFAEFPEPIDSVKTSIDIQSELKSRNKISDKEDKIVIRIGLHVGEVIRKDEDLFGHDVNLCSRIESMAPKGGIAASRALIDSFDDDSIIFREMGFVKLKNIIHPQQIYKIYVDEDEHGKETEKQLQENLSENGITIIDMDDYSVEQTYSVAILYMKNLGDDESESLAYNLTESIIDDFKYINSIRTASFNDVIEHKDSKLLSTDLGREMEVNTILKSSMLKDGDDLKLSFELLDINDGKISWKEKWSEPIINNKKIRKRVVESIASNFNVEMPSSLEELYSEEITFNLKALEAYHKGKYCSDQLKSNDDLKNGKQHLQLAIELDDQFVEAYSDYGLACHRLGQFDMAESTLQKGLKVAKRKNDKQGMASMYNVINIVNNTQGKYEVARENIEKALAIQVELNNKPKEAKFRSNYANCLNYLGKIDQALEQNNKAISIRESMEEENLGVNNFITANIYYSLGDFTNAIIYGIKSLGLFRLHDMSNFEGKLLTLLADLYMLLGQYEKMNKYIAESESIMKDFNDSFILGKLELAKSKYYLSIDKKSMALEHVDKSIDYFEMAEQRPFLKIAHMERIKLFLEMQDHSNAKKSLPKLRGIINKMNDSSSNPFLDLFEILLGEKDLTDDVLNVIANYLSADKALCHWYLAQIYMNENNEENSRVHHEKAISLLKERAKIISNERDKDTFLNQEYYNKRIQEKTMVKSIKNEEVKQESIFAFCPSCGFKNENKFSFCPSCGNDLKQ